jgi:hypothetical protein
MGLPMVRAYQPGHRHQLRQVSPTPRGREVMYKLIIAYENSDTWHTSQHPTHELAVSARERGLKAERIAILRDMAAKRTTDRKLVKWTAIVSERQSYHVR